MYNLEIILKFVRSEKQARTISFVHYYFSWNPMSRQSYLSSIQKFTLEDITICSSFKQAPKQPDFFFY